MGAIVLMGSGELTPTMVKVHRQLLGNLGSSPRAVFLDTPAGFQLNVDQLSRKAVEYFRTHIGYPLEVASFKSNDISSYDQEQALHRLRGADYILIGPGSPSYAVRQLSKSQIPGIITQRIRLGACLVAASAASLTVGAYTLPVYEIYKVGQEPEWLEGLGILGEFGMDCVVVPHWNNAEGGTHDTRFCYMGESRFRSLRELLRDDVSVLGLDEHTACIMDLSEDSVSVTGIGGVTYLSSNHEATYASGDSFSLSVFREGVHGAALPTPSRPIAFESEPLPEGSYWQEVHSLQEAFREGLASQQYHKATNAVLGLDEVVWKASQDLENDEFISQGREILREMVVLMGNEIESLPRSPEVCLETIVETLLEARDQSRKDRRWSEADAIRDWLHEAGVVVEDTRTGPVWRLDKKH
jgi:hypothetical protein